MALAGGAASVTGIVAYLLGTLFGGTGDLPATGAGGSPWVYALLFFVLATAHTGIRVGRKTYLVDMAPADERASYVAVSNTVIGVVLLVSGSLGVLGTFLSPYEVILVFAGLGLIGSVIALRLDEVE